MFRSRNSSQRLLQLLSLSLSVPRSISYQSADLLYSLQQLRLSLCFLFLSVSLVVFCSLFCSCRGPLSRRCPWLPISLFDACTLHDYHSSGGLNYGKLWAKAAKTRGPPGEMKKITAILAGFNMAVFVNTPPLICRQNDYYIGYSLLTNVIIVLPAN